MSVDRTTTIGSVGHGPREGVEWVLTDGPVGAKPHVSGGRMGGRCRAGLNDHPSHTTANGIFLQ